MSVFQVDIIWAAELASNTDQQQHLIEKTIEVEPTVKDNDIKTRIQNILKATNWFEGIQVKVENGVVFLSGKTNTETHKEWASNLAMKIKDSVAVVNKIKIEVSTAGEFQKETFDSIQEQWQKILLIIPYLILSLLILFTTWLVSKILKKLVRPRLKSRGIHPLLGDVLAKGVGIFCFLIGLYFVMRILGLTAIAFTLIGGTGILGIILGIAFRNITENALAGILLSIQKPFNNGDLVEIKGTTGYIQKLTIRATILMTLDGHIIQIPNSVVYKNVICNFSNNPNRRECFIIGIGYDESISSAQDIALNVLKKHPSILNQPEPLVLVRELAPETVNLCVYFWFDGNKYNWLKIKSSAIRLVKRAFQENGISMPGREFSLIAKEDIPVKVVGKEEKPSSKQPIKKTTEESSSISTHAEGHLSSEAMDIYKQVKELGAIDKEEDLLQSDSKTGN